MKRLVCLLMVVITAFSLLSGCSNGDEDPLAGYSKEEVIEYAHSLELQNNELFQQTQELQEKMTGIIGEDTETAAIKEFSDNSGRLTLVTLDDIIKLPAPLEYPNSTQSYNASKIAVTDNVYVKPSSNWSISLTGTQIELYHKESKISGIIKIGARDRTKDDITTDMLETTLTEFFNLMPQTTLKTSKIYLDDIWAGTDASARTFIDEEDAQLRCGLLGLGDLNMTYFFCYKGQQDSSKDELIITLLQTIEFMGQPLRLE